MRYVPRDVQYCNLGGNHWGRFVKTTADSWPPFALCKAPVIYPRHRTFDQKNGDFVRIVAVVIM